VVYNLLVGVPIFNIDKRPFALLCAYSSLEHGRRYVSGRLPVKFPRVRVALLTGKQQLEGHELSYLRAIGVFLLT